MSSGSYSSNKPDDGYGQGGYNRQYVNPSYNDGSQRGAPIQDGMTTEPSVGRFTEQEKVSSMFSRKPATPKNFEGSPAMAGQSNYGVHYSGQDSQFNAGGIVNLRPAPPRSEDKLNKSSSKGKK